MYNQPQETINCKHFGDVGFDIGTLLQGQTTWYSIKVPISCLVLFVKVCNAPSTLRKPQVANLLVVTDLTLDHSFKVKKYGGSTKKSTYDPGHSFKHKIVATNVKLPISNSCVLLVHCIGSQRLQILCYLYQYYSFLDHFVRWIHSCIW